MEKGSQFDNLGIESQVTGLSFVRSYSAPFSSVIRRGYSVLLYLARAMICYG